MSQALNLFTDSYLKRLKRPEMFNYGPNQAFGANMVHGSEEQNPFAYRDQSNAKFGNLGGNTNKVIEGPQTFAGDQLDPSLSGKTFTLPNQGSPNSIINDLSGMLMKSATAPLMQKGTDALSNWLTKGPSDAVGVAADRAFDAEAGIEGAEGAVPGVGTALSLLKDLITKKLLTDTTESVGKAGGTLGGAALGSAIFPGVGTILGGMLGGIGGGTLGKLLKKIF